jgi:hypothetical protein
MHFLRFIICLICGIIFVDLSWAGSLKIVWEANQEPDLQGYRVHWGIASKKYTSQKDVGPLTNCEITDLREGVAYYVAVTAVDYWGNESDFSQEVSATPRGGANPTLPETIQLRANYPNPFNPTTLIEVALPEGQFVKLSIYNGNGQMVRTLLSGYKEAGIWPITWDARDDQENLVTAGIYFCRLETTDRTITRAMTLLR